ncbi:MAG: histidine phosphatase family protein [Planctomycetota bacterium]|nr:histidine phosphatase family protein [Planctomycetota bacterium]MDA0932222.1 histidine phosphatase family protein [Planctomycetota bacterium]
MLPEVADFCRLYLFRHPELAPEDAARAIGSGPARLGRRGQQAVVDWLKLLGRVDVHGVYAPDRPQCEDPAAAVAAAKGLEVVADARLRDQALGDWEGKSWDDVAREDPDRVRDFFQDFGEIQAPGGESLGQAVERFLEWWQEARLGQAGRTLVVVTSGTMLTGFAAAMLGMRLSRAVSLNLPHAGLGVLDIFENGVRIGSWNPGGVGGVS